MKKQVLIVGLLVASLANATAVKLSLPAQRALANATAVKLSLPAQRALAREISNKLLSHVINDRNLQVAKTTFLTDDGKLFEKFQDALHQYVEYSERCAQQPDLLQNYARFLQGEDVNFTDSAYEIIKNAPNLSLGSSETPLKLTRTGNTKEEIARIFEYARSRHMHREQRQGEHSMLELNLALQPYYQNNPTTAQVIVDHQELLKAMPSFNTKLTQQEYEHLLAYAEQGKMDYYKVVDEAHIVVMATEERERVLRGLLRNQGLTEEFITRELPRINQHLNDQQTVIIALHSEPSMLTVPNSGRDQDTDALAALRQHDEVSASQYLVLWRQDATTEELGYVLLEYDNDGWQLASEKKFDSDSVSMHSKVNHLDLFDFDSPDRQERQVFRYMKGKLIENYDVTYAQLQDPRTIYDAIGKFLIDMNWSQHKFGQVIYPQDSKQAALFIANYKTWLTEEYDENLAVGGVFGKIQAALTTEKANLSNSDKLKTINLFLAQLPSLIAKAAFVENIANVMGEKGFTTNERRRQLFTEAIDNYLIAMFKWGGMGKLLSSFNSPSINSTQVFKIMPILAQHGVTDRQLKDKIFTENVFNKLSEGKIVTEQNLNKMRMLLNKQEIEKLVANFDDLPFAKQELVERILSLPLLIQRDGLAKKLANGLSSPSALQQALRNIEAKSMYRPLAEHLLAEIAKLKDKPRMDFVRSILEKIKNTSQQEQDFRRQYFLDKKSPIIYFISPSYAHEVNGKSYLLPVVKIGQVDYSDDYVERHINGNELSLEVDREKLSKHKRFKQIFATGIDAILVDAQVIPSVNDHKMRALILELFADDMRQAEQAMLQGISSGDGDTEFLQFNVDNVEVHDPDGRPLMAREDFIRKILSVIGLAWQETRKRFDAHGYVSVATPVRASTSNSETVKHSSQEDTGFLQRELPVELKPKQTTRQQQPERETQNTQATPRAPPQPSAEQLRREAEAQAQRELDAKITQLIKSIGRQDLPADTPIWLHLRALIHYADTNIDALAQRADLRDKQERFLAFTAPEATTLPTVQELEAVALALGKYMDKREDISDKHKHQVYNTLQKELEQIKQKLVAHELDLARPTDSKQPPTPKEDIAAQEETSPATRLPPTGTLKKIAAADVEDFLQGELLPTYALFSELMLALDVNDVRELTAKFNETLDMVNSNVILPQEEKIQRLSIPLDTHLIGYERGESDFIDRTLWKLQIIATYIEHPQKNAIAHLLNEIIRAARIQRFATVEQLNTALKNNGEEAQVTAEDFSFIKVLAEESHQKWQEDWLE